MDARSLLGALALAACAAPTDDVADPPLVVRHVGVESDLPHVVGVQAYLRPRDYETEDAFAQKLSSWLVRADDEGLLRGDTLVVFPEYLGTWLVAVDEGASVRDATTVHDAMTPLALMHLPDFLALRGADVADGDTYAIFAAKSVRMAQAYQDVLADLARTHGVTIVGGSILLPGPTIVDGRIVARPGAPLVNASFVFGPDGALMGDPIIKAFPTKDEQAFATAGDASELPTFDTRAGRIGVLVCADAWFPAAYDAMPDVDVLVAPVFSVGDGSWAKPWGGYSGWPAPIDVDPDDVGAITEGDAWRKYALPARAQSHAIPTALAVPLRGALWDLGADGAPLVVQGGAAVEVDAYDGPALIDVARAAHDI